MTIVHHFTNYNKIETAYGNWYYQQL